MSKEHSELDPKIDGKLIFSLLDDPLKRQFLYYLFTVYRDVFLEFEDDKRIAEIMRIIYSEDLKNDILDFDKDLVKDLIKYRILSPVKTYKELEKLTTTTKELTLRNVFCLYFNKNDEFETIGFFLEPLQEILNEMFMDWSKMGFTETYKAFSGIKCRVSKTIHKFITIASDKDGDDFIIFPRHTYEVLDELKFFNPILFAIEPKIIKIHKESGKLVDKITNYINKIFPEYINLRRKILNLIKGRDKAKDKNINNYYVEKMKEWEEPPEILDYSDGSIPVNSKLYELNLNLLFENLEKLLKITEKANEYYELYFRERPKQSFNLLRKKFSDITYSQKFESEIIDLETKFIELDDFITNLDIKDIQISYHRHALWLLED